MLITNLNHTISDYAQRLEADFFGVADLGPAQAAILEQGGPAVARYPRAISMGVALLHPIVDQLPQRAEQAVAINYRQHAYDVVNARLDEMANRMAGKLQRLGYAALPIPASKRLSDGAGQQRIRSFFSHKIAAHLAGLGWIGRSCLLITPQAGPRVRWTSVLTDAPLQPTGSMQAPQCGDCRACVDICPVEAITGQLFDPAEPREARLDAHKCNAYIESLPIPVCGMCLYVCPYGNR